MTGTDQLAASPDSRNFTVRTIETAAIWGVTVIALFLLWYARRVFLLTFAGLLFGIFLQTLARWVTRYLPLRYGWALFSVVLLLVVLLAATIWLIGARISGQIEALSAELPKAIDQLRGQLQRISGSQWLSEQLPPPGQFISQNNMLGQLTGITWGALNVIAELAIVLAVGLYGAAQPQLYRHGFVKLFPPHRRPQARKAIAIVWSTLSRWILAQLLAMAIVGLLTTAGLWLIGAKLPLAMGLLAFGLSIVPNIGPILSASPAILLAWVQGPWFALGVAALYFVIQTCESYGITPLIQLRATHLPPAIHILAVLLLGIIGGFLGVLVAAPLVIASMVLVQQLYVRRAIEDRPIESEPQ